MNAESDINYCKDVLAKLSVEEQEKVQAARLVNQCGSAHAIWEARKALQAVRHQIGYFRVKLKNIEANVAAGHC